MFHQPLNVGCSFVHDPNPRLVTARLSASRPSWPSKVSWEQRTLGTYPPGHARKLGLWCSDGPVRLWNSWVCVEYGESHMNGWIPKMTKLVISLCIDCSHKYINIYIILYNCALFIDRRLYNIMYIFMYREIHIYICIVVPVLHILTCKIYFKPQASTRRCCQEAWTRIRSLASDPSGFLRWR